MDDRGCSAIQCGGVGRVWPRGHSTVGGRHGGHLSLEQLQDHINVRCHTSFQSVELGLQQFQPGLQLDGPVLWAGWRVIGGPH